MMSVFLLIYTNSEIIIEISPLTIIWTCQFHCTNLGGKHPRVWDHHRRDMYKEKASGELSKSQGSAGWKHQGAEVTETKFLPSTA